jgi:hypothetical protein
MYDVFSLQKDDVVEDGKWMENAQVWARKRTEM